MKATRGRVVDREESKPSEPKPGDDWKDRKEVDFPERETPSGPVESEVSNPDELIMVMMPRVSYDAFEALAAKHGGSAAQAMSTALKLLEETLKGAEKADDVER